MIAERLSPEFLNGVMEKIGSKKRIFSAVLRVENTDGSFAWTGASGEMQEDSPYFIASVTKLCITIVYMRLIDEKLLTLDDPISRYLPQEWMQGLHVLKGREHSQEITIRHLISNTSGLPDYFFHKQADGQSAASRLLSGHDDVWPLERTIETIRQLRPNFYPGKKGKAVYSDTNYQILGYIIEKITGKTVGEVFREIIFDPLGLKHTYAYQDVNDTTPAPFYYKTLKLWLPNYMCGITPEGGVVSTAGEFMQVIRGFFQGRFFAQDKIQGLKQWNLLFPPPGMFYFGIGLEKLFTPRLFSPLKPIREILGFWGQTGSFAWHHPDTGLYFTGTTNQIDGSGHMAAGSAINKIIKRAM